MRRAPRATDPGARIDVRLVRPCPAADTTLLIALQWLARGMGGHVVSLLGDDGAGWRIDLHRGTDRSAQVSVRTDAGLPAQDDAQSGVLTDLAVPVGAWLILALRPSVENGGCLQVRSAIGNASLPDPGPRDWVVHPPIGIKAAGGGPPPASRDCVSARARIGRPAPMSASICCRWSPARWPIACARTTCSRPIRRRARWPAGSMNWWAPNCPRAWSAAAARPIPRCSTPAAMPSSGRHSGPIPRCAARAGTARHQSPAQAPAQYTACHLHSDAMLDAGWDAEGLYVAGARRSAQWLLRVSDGLAARGARGGPLRQLFRLRGPAAPPSAGRADAHLHLPRLCECARGHARPADGGRSARIGVAARALPPGLRPVAVRTARRWLRGAVQQQPPAPAQRDARTPALGAGGRYAAARLAAQEIGQPFDVITDHDLHRLGRAALDPFSVVLTGHSPEYWSTPMWDGLWRYLDSGGRLMYLGGNGLYWKTAYNGAADMIEVRRAEDGTRASIAPAGEYHGALDGAFGGLWRRATVERPSRSSAWAWRLKASSGRLTIRSATTPNPPKLPSFSRDSAGTFGHHGLLGGGASGWEIDRIDEDLGTPAGTWWLARSRGHAPSMLRTKEELLSYIAPFDDAKARSDVALVPAGKGDVFAVGSMTWVGSLHPAGEGARSDADAPTDVARITANVIRRFLDPRPVPRRTVRPHG